MQWGTLNDDWIRYLCNNFSYFIILTLGRRTYFLSTIVIYHENFIIWVRVTNDISKSINKLYKKHINVLVGTISRTVVFVFLSLIKHNVNMREF